MSIVFKTPKSALNTTSKAIQNLGSGECPEPVLEKAELEYTENGEYTVTPEEGVDGFSEIDVTVNVPSDVNNQNKTVSPSTSSQTVEADSGYSGLGTVTVNAVTAAIDSNIQSANILSGVTILGVEGSDAGYDAGYSAGESDGEAAGYQNGYDAGYTDGQAACPAPALTSLSVTPSTSAQSFDPADEGYEGFDSVSVSAVTSAIDQNIVAGNIKSGVTILGVQGTVQEGITPSGNINITNTSSTNVTNYATAQVVDANLVASNIKDGVSILGVTGSYDPQPAAYAESVTIGEIGETILEPDPNEGDYFNSVTVTVDTDPMGSALNPFYTADDASGYDYESGYISFFVDSGSIDPQTGYYVAQDSNGYITVNVMPCMYNPDYDDQQPESPSNPEEIFPNDFDVTNRDITVSFDKSNASFTEVDDPETGEFDHMEVEISESVLMAIDQNFNPDTWLIEPLQASTRSLDLLTNEPQQLSISSGEPWEIEIDQPNRNLRSLSKSGLRDGGEPEPEPEPTLDIDMMNGDAGVYTLNINSTTDQSTGFTLRGLNSGNEVHIDVASLANYFTIESRDDSNAITWSSYDQNHTLEYSDDGGETWSTMTLTSVNGRYEWSLTIDAYDVIMFRGNNDFYAYNTNSATTNYEGCYFSSTGEFEVCGNIMSLISSENFVNASFQTKFTFAGLFKNSLVVKADSLILPNSVSDYCYYEMFRGCDSLTEVPELPATALAKGCYSNMFNGCSALENMPDIPATLLAENCYFQMFAYCGIVEPIETLPAEYMQQNCYGGMFSSCSSLTTLPELPSQHLAYGCYQNMFYGCSSLTSIPENSLPATTLAPSCYARMFQNCYNLIDVPEDLLPATTLDRNCYEQMFSNCYTLALTPVLPATTLADACYRSMFSYSENLEEVTCLATDITASDCIQNWLNGVAASGTLYKDPNMNDFVVGTNVPSGWTIADYDPNGESGGGGVQEPEEPGGEIEI